MLKIKNLTAGIDDKNILNNINLNINSGEFHVIMGTNGTGKSTLVADILYHCKKIPMGVAISATEDAPDLDIISCASLKCEAIFSKKGKTSHAIPLST